MSVLTEEEEAWLVEEIRRQELRTSAEIRVCISPQLVVNAKQRAWEVFNRHGMRETKHRNAALIVLFPKMKTLAVIGDVGLDAVVNSEFWESTVAAMVKRMQSDGPLESLREGLRLLGDALSRHWPADQADVDELPNDLLTDS